MLLADVRVHGRAAARGIAMTVRGDLPRGDALAVLLLLSDRADGGCNSGSSNGEPGAPLVAMLTVLLLLLVGKLRSALVLRGRGVRRS